MESFARQLERQGQFSPAATQDESRTTSVSPIPVSTPTLPMRPAAPSPTADVQVQESQHLKRLFRGEFEAEATSTRRNSAGGRVAQRCFRPAQSPGDCSDQLDH